MKPVSSSRLRRAYLWLAPTVLAPCALLAQTSQPASPPSATDEAVVLSVFKVSEAAASSYQAKEANSAGRIRTALQDTPQSITVITRDFMDDIGTGRLLDAMRFSAGVTESNFPNRLGRITLRGFQQDAAQQSFYIDGFRYSAISAGYNSDGTNLDRVEIVKGPNAILAAAGSPGGSINMITKSPKFQPGGYVKIQLGQYLGNRAEFDLTGPLPVLGGKTVAYRVVAMATDSKGYQDNQFQKALLVDPSVTVRLGAATEVTVKGHYAKTDVSVLNLPLSPLVGPNDPIALYPGLTPKWSGTGGFKPSDPGEEARILGELTHKFSPQLQMRFGAMTAVLLSNGLQDGGIGGITTQSGNINPTTGLYTPGTTWRVFNYGLPTQTVTSTSVAFPDFTNRSVGFTDTVNRQFNRDYLFNAQNDYVYTHDFSADIHSTTVAGVSFNRHAYHTVGYNNIAVPLVGTIDAPNYAATYANASAVNRLKGSQYAEVENTRQGYIAEVLRLFNDRVYLSGSASHLSYDQQITQGSIFGTKLGGALAVPVPSGLGFAPGTYYATPGYNTLSGAKADYGYGLLVKPIKEVSLFVDHSSNTNPPTLNAFPGSQNQYGDQTEFGAKTSWLEGRLDFSVTHFSIVQHNVSVYDITSNTFIPLGTTTSKGFEFEFNGKLTPELSVIGAYSRYKARNGFGQLLRSAPDKSGSVAVKYQFNRGPLRSLWLMLNSDYLDRRSGENPTSISIDAASASPSVLAINGTVRGDYTARTLSGAPVSPTFFLPARALLGLNGGYTINPHWKVWFKIDNLTDKTFIQASLSRGTLSPGAPRNVTGAVTYRF